MRWALRRSGALRRRGARLYKATAALSGCHSWSRRSIEKAALAGLVDGSLRQGSAGFGIISLLKSSNDLLPLQNMAFMGAWLNMTLRSLGSAFLIAESCEPIISHCAITSHTAIWHVSSRERFSSILAGTFSLNSPAITFQNLFCGCP